MSRVTKNIPYFTAPYCIAFEKSAGAVVYCLKDGNVEFLVMQYPHGHWEFPRGHVESGETDYDTAYREIWEETGLQKESLTIKEGFRETASFGYIARGDERADRIAKKRCITIRKKVIYFLAHTSDVDIVLSDEHHAFLWLPFEDALHRVTFDNAKRIITAAHEYLRNKK